jgi:ESAT-6 family protein
MANILVTPEQLHEISRQLNSGATNIESLLSQLQGQVLPLRSEWRGQAQAQFEQLWTEWQKSAAGIHHALTGISQLTASAATNYADTEQSIAASFRR